PMLWTSIATGKRPYKHGVLGFTEPDPHSGGIRPITSISRKTKAIWNILNQEGFKSIVVGWWPSHPAEPINGVMVSNHYQRAVAPYGKPWPMKPGTVHPPRLIRNLAELRLHPQELDVGLVMNFLPRLPEIDQEKDRRVENLAKIIADCTTVNRAVTAIMDHEPWDFVAVYYDAIDHFSHGFMNYHPPRLPWVDEKDFELYKNVVESGYIYHDILLGTLLQRVSEDTTVMIVSDHGFHSDHLRPRNIPKEPAGPAAQHRHYGIFAVKGPGIKKDEIIYGASLLDITPTILTILGLPVGEDMDGKPLVNIFEDPPELITIPSWDDLPGDDGRHPPDAVIDPIEAKEAIEQLIQLGYIDRPDENREKASRECVRELRYNLARSYMDAGLYTEAVPVFEELVDEWPDEYRFGIQLVTCYKALGRITRARKLLEEVFDRKKKNAVKARKELKEFRKELEGKKIEDFSEEEKRKLRNLRAEASTSLYAIEFLMGSLLFAEGKKEEALQHLKRAEKADRNQPALYNKLGDVYIKMKRFADAETAFRRSVEIDPDNSEGHLGLARTFLGIRKSRDAAIEALSAVGLQYHNPRAHYVLGVALHRMGRIAESVEALRVAITQNPNYTEAYRRLAYIYRKRLNDPEEANRYIKAAKEARDRIRKLKKGETDSILKKEVAAKTSLSSEDIKKHPTLRPETPFDPEKTVV
ncbi:MAG: tetratricopeptide repeat protein, partial [Nitrospirae bacterium]